MKSIFIWVLFLPFSINAQKIDGVNINSIQNVESTDYVVTFSTKYSKVGFESFYNNNIILYNTKTYQIKQIEISTKSNIRKITSDIKAKYLNSNFILIECVSNVEKILPKASSMISELYLLELNSFEIVKVSTNNFELKSWTINTQNDALVVVEQENGENDDKDKAENITVLNLKEGTKKIVFSSK